MVVDGELKRIKKALQSTDPDLSSDIIARWHSLPAKIKADLINKAQAIAEEQQKHNLSKTYVENRDKGFSRLENPLKTPLFYYPTQPNSTLYNLINNPDFKTNQESIILILITLLYKPMCPSELIQFYEQCKFTKETLNGPKKVTNPQELSTLLKIMYRMGLLKWHALKEDRRFHIYAVNFESFYNLLGVQPEIDKDCYQLDLAGLISYYITRKYNIKQVLLEFQDYSFTAFIAYLTDILYAFTACKDYIRDMHESLTRYSTCHNLEETAVMDRKVENRIAAVNVFGEYATNRSTTKPYNRLIQACNQTLADLVRMKMRNQSLEQPPGLFWNLEGQPASIFWKPKFHFLMDTEVLTGSPGKTTPSRKKPIRSSLKSRKWQGRKG